MAVSVEWEIKATEFTNCNCSYGCPCQFNALPTHGNCRYVAGFQIEQGHFGDVKLDGLRAVTMAIWPGAVHEGNGTLQVVIDERADARQRDALAKILTGQETLRHGDDVVGVRRDVSDQAADNFRKDRPGDRRGRPIWAVGGPWNGFVERRADPQSSDWRGASRSDRFPAELRIQTRRDRQRHVDGNRGAPDGAQGQLGAVLRTSISVTKGA